LKKYTQIIYYFKKPKKKKEAGQVLLGLVSQAQRLA
jgi:hypothetical protein